MSFEILNIVESERLHELEATQWRLPEKQKMTQRRTTDTLQARD